MEITVWDEKMGKYILILMRSLASFAFNSF